MMGNSLELQRVSVECNEDGAAVSGEVGAGEQVGD